MNCFLPRWTVNSFCFLGVRVNSDLKRRRLLLIFESAFWSSLVSFIIDELAVEDDPHEF